MGTKTLKDSKKVWDLVNREWASIPCNFYINPNLIGINFKDGISLDVEDDEQGNFVGLGIYDPKGNTSWYWNDFDLVKTLTIPKFIAHNGVTDISKLIKWGFKIDESWLLYDTQIMAHVLDSSRKSFGLKALAKEDLGISYPSYEDLCGKRKNKNHTTLDKLDPMLVADYNRLDCWCCYKLYEFQTKGRDAESHPETPETRYFNTIEKLSSWVFQEMTNRGIRLDLPYLNKLKIELEEQRDKVEHLIKNELGDLNLNSPKQLLETLHTKEIYPEFKGKPSTDKRALERFKNNLIITNLLQFSETESLLSSFVYPYLERNTEIVHPNFYQCGTRTGRPTCKDPNLLQIPRRTENGKRVRCMFIPKEGYIFGDCDFGQIEPRLLAHLSKDKSLCALFNQQIDFHDYTANNLNIAREKAKVLNLSVGYRATFKSVSLQLHCSDAEAQKEIDKWWSLFPELHDWQQQLIYESKKKGYFTTLMGRRIKVEGLDEWNKWKREHAERQLINNIGQASAAEVMKLAMINVSKIKDVFLLVQVYDELLYECKQALIEELEKKVLTAMINSVELQVPLVVDATRGMSWGECKK